MKKTKFGNVSQLNRELSSIDIQKMLLEKAKETVLSTAVALLEQDMLTLCGERFARKVSDLCHRGGSEKTTLFLEGAKYAIPRPRARRGKEEVELPSLAKLRDRDLLDQQMLSRIMLGASSRNYEGIVGGFAKKTGISRSSVSRAFKRGSEKDLDAINGADLAQYRFVGILIDGTGVGGRTLVMAVGLTEDRQKVPLGLKEGDTENAGVVKDLLTSIMARNFTFAAEGILAVLDGGKALRAAVKALWGDRVLIQRCWIHKLRNLRGYTPKSSHGQLAWRMKKMMAINSYDLAKKELDSLASWLRGISCDAEASLLEAGDELLTVHKLGIVGTFRKVLTTTNIAESMIGVTKGKVRNVKNWGYHPKTGDKVKRDKALRWVASAIQAHRPKMRRIKAAKEQMETLIASLNQLAVAKKSA